MENIGIREIISLIFIFAGLFFLVASAVGMLRLPDFYSRLHASGNSETLGLMLSLVGIAIQETQPLVIVKLVFIFLLVFLANPIGTHVLGRSAYKSDYPVWIKDNAGEYDNLRLKAVKKGKGEE